jgi:hypothetical protein
LPVFDIQENWVDLPILNSLEKERKIYKSIKYILCNNTNQIYLYKKNPSFQGIDYLVEQKDLINNIEISCCFFENKYIEKTDNIFNCKLVI